MIFTVHLIPIASCSCMGGRLLALVIFPSLAVFLIHTLVRSAQVASVLFTQIADLETIDSFFFFLQLHQFMCFCFGLFSSVVLCFHPAPHTRRPATYTISQTARHPNHRCGQQPARTAKILIGQKVVLCRNSNVWPSHTIKPTDMLLTLTTALKL